MAQARFCVGEEYNLPRDSAGICHKGKIAGSIDYLYLDWSSYKTEIGYWLGKDFEGLGLATRLVTYYLNTHLQI
ncbi:GNAT family N-acetyltransferase [Bacillus timonensis]|uniref:GNAT family N-acetyltransferase n=1 Tax=Bacillus timonensis TaxID=1033734 RepID=UPI003D6EB32F